MSAAYGTGKRGKATRLHAEVVRARGRCEAKGWNGLTCSKQLQCAHIISRRYAATRCDPTNAYCMCAAHHRYFTEWPYEFHRFIEATIGPNAYDDLRARAMAGVKTNDAYWQSWIDQLQEAA